LELGDFLQFLGAKARIVLSTGGVMAQDTVAKPGTSTIPIPVNRPLWELGITELAGRNIEAAGREDVNDMLQHGWVLLHIYTLKYRENSTWRERPMAILGRPA
jgi:hypothetical protein